VAAWWISVGVGTTLEGALTVDIGGKVNPGSSRLPPISIFTEVSYPISSQAGFIGSNRSATSKAFSAS
jgi:hypothetical protein